MDEINQLVVGYVAIPFSPFPTQVKIVIASCIIHNWVIDDRGDEFMIQTMSSIQTILR
jgi:hypothetical protein